MSFSAVFKSITADKVLAPVREALVTQMDAGSRVMEIGCGTGDLLFRAGKKIRKGTGIDLKQGMIEFARKRKETENRENLDFLHGDFLDFVNNTEHYDMATSTLCLHEMGEDTAVEALKLMGRISSRILIADYAEPHSVLAKISIEMDEMISGHYGLFRKYRDKGYMPALFEEAGLNVIQTQESPIDGMKIWVAES